MASIEQRYLLPAIKSQLRALPPSKKLGLL